MTTAPGGRKWLRNSFVQFLLEDLSLREISPETSKSGLKNTSISFVRNIGLENAKLFLESLINAVNTVEKEEAK